MTDKQTLLFYRIKQAEETLSDAKIIFNNNGTLRSVANRTYYSMFYAILSLFIYDDKNIKTSKHIGVITIFDKEYIKTGKIEIKYSKILHRMFDVRQESDYKELMELSKEDVSNYINEAEIFIGNIKKYIGSN